MNKSQTTIADIIAIKGGSTSELCQYALAKGLSIPDDPDYILSLSELKAIAPTLVGRATSKSSTIINRVKHKEKDIKGAETIKAIGIVNWYDIEKGFGVLQSIHDNREYFIHQSKIGSQYKTMLKEGDIVIFTPDFDKKRNRDIAINIRYFYDSPDLKWVITSWMNEEYIKAIHIEKILINYLRFFSTDNGECFGDANNRLLDIISSFSTNEIEIKKVYDLYKNIFDKQTTTRLSEMTDLIMMEKIPSEMYHIILETAKTPYTCLVIANTSIELTEAAIIKAIEVSQNFCDLLDDLIRFAKEINEQDIKESLDNDKSLITDEDFLHGINGQKIISATIEHLYNHGKAIEFKTLIKQGYIRNLDNTTLLSSRPEIIVDLKVYAYNDGLVDEIDVQFIIDNIDKFTAHSLVKIKQHYTISNDSFSNIFLCYIRYLLSEKNSSYNEVTEFAGEILDIYKLITDHRDYLAENAEEEYQELLLSLYKASLVHTIDEHFIIYHIKKFSISEIFNILCGEQVEIFQRKKILSALVNDLLDNNSYDRLTNLTSVCKQAKELLNDGFSSWMVEVCSSLSGEKQYFLWKNRISEIYPSSYIRENLLTTNEEGYIELYDLCQSQLINVVTASNELWDVLNQNQKITNRPAFYKVFYCIKYLIKIDSSNKETIEQVENDYYTIILWFLSYSKKFDYELLCRLFIYFLPEDQVRIIKRLFYMMEEGEIQLSVKMLDNLLRVDAILYKLISEQHPEVPIDVSSEIVIKALVHLTETENFSSNKDVLNIVIKAGQYSKNERFKIGSYFDECRGRMVHYWEGNKTKCGHIKQIKEGWYGVEVYQNVEGRVYRKFMGYHTETVVNTSFHTIVDAIRSINGRKWNAEKKYWEVPTDAKDRLFDIAKEYGLSIEGTNNTHMKTYRVENEGKPARVDYCEGRPALREDEDFLWCRNSKCFFWGVREHTKKEWENYTLLDFCRILGLNTDSIDSKGRTVRYGKYLTFSSIINRANFIIEHLYCRECGKMLEPVNIANFLAHLVTHFHCTNTTCEKYHDVIYISKCFNWKCNGVIDDRDTKKCPNGWNICPECGSCCSTRTVGQRIANNNEIGIPTNPYLIDFYNRNLGHLEKREFYCWKCGSPMRRIGETLYDCPTCGVGYERKYFDYYCWKCERLMTQIGEGLYECPRCRARIGTKTF